MKKILHLLILCLFAWNVQAELNIDISGGKTEPMPIAVAEFTGAPKASELREIVKNDLESSGLFRVIDKDAYLQKISNVSEVPDFQNWQAINAQALVVAHVEYANAAVQDEDAKLRLSFYLWDVYEGQHKLANVLVLTQTEWRRLGHIMADMIYSRITGESGYFDTRIVYVEEKGPVSKRVKRLAMMDQDGANRYYLTDGKSMVLTPRFAPNMQKIAYLSFDKGKPRIMIMDLKKMVSWDLGPFKGMNFAPRFSNDGQKLLLSEAVRDNTEIFMYDLNTHTKTQLTFNNSTIDTSPCFSPDDSKIVFNSDRSGSQQLYVMDANGKNVKRISFGSKGSYATPVWSPRGDYIAFTKIQNNTFYIGVMRPDGSGERLLTQGFLVEGPDWAPNGRVLVFFKQQPYNDGSMGQTGLYTIDVTGNNEKHLKTPANASDPAWSPLLFEKKM